MAGLLDTVKSLFSNVHTSDALGIDIGSSSIKVVVVGKDKDDRAVLKNYAEIALGPRGGVAIGQATSLPPEKIGEALRDILREAGITLRHVFMAIHFNASLLLVAEMPDVGKKELESMVPIEARRYIPVPMREVSLDWWTLPKKKSTVEAAPGSSGKETVGTPRAAGKVEVILAAIHNDVLKRYETIRHEAKLPGDTAHYEIELFSTIRAVMARDTSPALVMDFGAGSTKLIIVDDGVVRGSHVVPSGGQDITLGLVRAKNISFDEAEDLKCRVGMSGDEEGRDVESVADILLASILTEAVRFVENYESKYKTKIRKIVLVGGGALLEGIDKTIKGRFSSASVTVGDPFARLDSPAFLAPTLKSLSPRFAVAVGIALKGLEE